MYQKSYSRLRTGVISLLILIGLVLVAAALFSHQQQTRQIKRHLAPVSIQAARLIQYQMQEIGNAFDILADAGRRYFSGEAALTELDTRINNLRHIISSVGNFALTDADGFVIATNLPDLYMQNVAYRDYFARTRESRTPGALILSPPFQALTGRRIFTLSRPIFDNEGEFSGIIITSVDTSLLRAMIETTLDEKDSSLQFIVAHGNGSPIFSVPDSRVDLEENLIRPDSPLFRHQLSERRHNTLEGRIQADSATALIHIRTVNPDSLALSDPMLVVTLTEKHQAYRDWYLLLLVLALLFTIIAIGALLLLRHEKRHMLKERRARRELTRLTRRLGAIIEGTDVGTWEWNTQTGETIFNERWAEIIGYRLEELEPTTEATWRTHAHPDDLQRSDALLQAHFSGESAYYECEARMRHRDGHWVWVLSRGKVASWTADGHPEWMYGTHQEITERKEEQRRTTRMAYIDSLTELPNRRLLDERLESALALARRHRRTLALMFLDLDNFKQVNDRLGHHVGDRLLKEVARRLRACIRESDTVARNGGDEFVVLLPEISFPEDADQVARKILETLRQPITLEGEELLVPPSIGIAVYPHDALEASLLLKHADEAMYAAKRAGRNCYRMYQPLSVEEPPVPSPDQDRR